MMRSSTIQILITPPGGSAQDITRSVLYDKTKFNLQANAVPGNFTVTVRDKERALSFSAGSEIALVLDGQPFAGGFVKDVGRGNFFPAVDTKNLSRVRSRMWTLTGTDFNTWFDTRVVHNRLDYFSELKEPGGDIGVMARFFISRFIDIPIGLDYHTFVDDTGVMYPAGAFVNQGEYWRVQMDDFCRIGGIVYYIDASKNLHVHIYEKARVPWKFTDYRPDGKNTIGFREGTYSEQGLQLVTDALVWGGTSLPKRADALNSQAIGVVFARYPDPPAKDKTYPGKAAWTGTLKTAVSDTDTTWTLDSFAGMPEPAFPCKIDSEDIFIALTPKTQLKNGSLSGTQVQVSRAMGIAGASAHAAGAKIHHANEAPISHSKATEQTAIDRQALYGRWQMAEVNVGAVGYLLQDSVDMRAYEIVAGLTGADPVTGVETGLNKPLESVTLSWFAHQVPLKDGVPQHILPGYVVEMLFYTLGKDLEHPVITELPCRSIDVTFPTIPGEGGEPVTYVRFDGQFGIAYTDSRFLWTYLLKRRGKLRPMTYVTVDNSSAGATHGAVGTFQFIEKPDGVRTVFSVPFGYLTGTSEVYMGGLLQRPNIEYKESSPGLGQITFTVPPSSDDTLFMRCRTNEK